MSKHVSHLYFTMWTILFYDCTLFFKMKF